MTTLTTIYDAFLNQITDDMYMELNEAETYSLLQSLFENSLHWFEFPRFDLYSYDLTLGAYPTTLTNEEINILATYMVVEWMGQQLATVELIRMKYSGSDFKFTSQANHIHKLTNLKKEYERKGFHLQRLYKRRKIIENGEYRSNWSVLRESSTFD